MRARRPLVALLLLLGAASTSAESHKLGAAAAISNSTGHSNLWGGRLALETAPWNKYLKPDPRRLRHLSITTEVTVHAGAHEISATESSTRTQYTAVVGPRFTFGKHESDPHLYVHALTGPVWTSDKTSNVTNRDTGWAIGAGIGADYMLPRTAGSGGLQVQINLLRRYRVEPEPQTFAQFSFGVVLKFE